MQIVEVEQPFDRVKNQRRAFIFITYESEEIVEQVVANPKQTVGGKEVRSLTINIILWRAAGFVEFLRCLYFLCCFKRSYLFVETISADFITTVWMKQQIDFILIVRIELFTVAFHGGIVGWLLRIVVMVHDSHRNILVWLCCSRLASIPHIWNIVTGFLTGSRPDRRKVTYHRHWWCETLIKVPFVKKVLSLAPVFSQSCYWAVVDAFVEFIFWLFCSSVLPSVDTCVWTVNCIALLVAGCHLSDVYFLYMFSCCMMSLITGWCAESNTEGGTGWQWPGSRRAQSALWTT